MNLKISVATYQNQTRRLTNLIISNKYKFTFMRTWNLGLPSNKVKLEDNIKKQNIILVLYLKKYFSD